MSSADKSEDKLDGGPAENIGLAGKDELRLMLAQLGQDMARLSLDVTEIGGRIKKMNKKILRLEKRMDRFEDRMERFENKMDLFEDKMSNFESKITTIETTLGSVKDKTDSLERDTYRQRSDLRGIELAMRMASLGFHGRRMEPLRNDLVTQGGALLEGDDDRVERLAY